MKKLKKIVALTVAVVTAVVTAASASAYTISNSNWTSGHNWMEKKNAVTSSTVNGIPEFTRSYMDSDIKYYGKIFLNLDHYPKSGWVVAALPADVTSVEEAFYYANHMRIKDYYGNDVITELRYNKQMKRFTLISWGTYQQDYNGSVRSFLMLMSMINTKDLRATLISPGTPIVSGLGGEFTVTKNMSTNTQFKKAGLIKEYKDVGGVSLYFNTDRCFPFLTASIMNEQRTQDIIPELYIDTNGTIEASYQFFVRNKTPNRYYQITTRHMFSAPSWFSDGKNDEGWFDVVLSFSL